MPALSREFPFLLWGDRPGGSSPPHSSLDWWGDPGPEAALRGKRPPGQPGPRAELDGPKDVDVGGAALAKCKASDKSNQALGKRNG